MKKMICCFLCAVLMLSVCSACLAETKTLYNHGMDVIHLMAEMIESDDYVNLFTVNTEIREIIDELDDKIDDGQPDPNAEETAR